MKRVATSRSARICHQSAWWWAKVALQLLSVTLVDSGFTIVEGMTITAGGFTVTEGGTQLHLAA